MTDRHGPAGSSGRSLLVGVDVGGSKIAVLVVDEESGIFARRTIPHAVGAPAEAAGHIVEAVTSTLADAGAGIDRVVAIGVGVPGRVDRGSGVVSLAVNLGWRRLPLRSELEAILGVRCAIENDVRAAAAGILERRVLGSAVTDFVYLSVGTGISAGIILSGRVHRGTRGLAGEVGHVVVDVDGEVCPCGLRGCLETIASGPAIARAAERAIADGGTSVLAGRSPIQPADVFAAAASGDSLAVGVVDHAGRSLARAIHALVMTYDLERVVLGGGVTGAGAAFLDPILGELEAMRSASDLAAEMLPRGSVTLSPDGADSGAWGAVTIARAIHQGRSKTDREPSAAIAGGRPKEVVAREAAS
jgi:glucokinase